MWILAINDNQATICTIIEVGNRVRDLERQERKISLGKQNRIDSYRWTGGTRMGGSNGDGKKQRIISQLIRSQET
jgi:galactose mutarotase-like enzyme